MKRKSLFIPLFMFVFILNINSQRPKIIDYIETKSEVKIKEDEKIDNLIREYLGEDKAKQFEYRVQVFSSNKQKIAKDKSAEIEDIIKSQYPNIGVYRLFVSPFWKVRVGNFNSKDEAQLFLEQLVTKFPKLRKNTYIVRETRLTKNEK